MQPEQADHRQANVKKLTKLRSVLDVVLRQVLIRGFHGVVTLKITVHDGTIQAINESIERKHR
jgi:urease alpha subunit